MERYVPAVAVVQEGVPCEKKTVTATSGRRTGGCTGKVEQEGKAFRVLDLQIRSRDVQEAKKDFLSKSAPGRCSSRIYSRSPDLQPEVGVYSRKLEVSARRFVLPQECVAQRKKLDVEDPSLSHWYVVPLTLTR